MQKLIAQFSKFAVVGGINTALDFAILNLLMWMTDIYQGKWILLLNAIAFTAAVINSYLLNKHWTFKKKPREQEGNSAKQFSQFIAVSIVGLLINSGIVYFVATFVPPVFGLQQELWANIAKITATGLSLIWNFIGYKFFVFKR